MGAPATPVKVMIQHIGTCFSGFFSSSGNSENDNAEHSRVVIVYSDNSEQVVFIGPKFSEEEYKKQIEVRKKY